MILKVVLVLTQRTSLSAHPYDDCREAGNAPALRRTATSSRRTHREALARARTPTCAFLWNGERAGRSINLKETGVRGVFLAKGPDSSVGGVPVVCCPDDDHMEEEVQLKAVPKSSAESKVDDGQVEQEDIAPEEEAAADPEEMLRKAGRIGRARGRKKFLETWSRCGSS